MSHELRTSNRGRAALAAATGIACAAALAVAPASAEDGSDGALPTIHGKVGPRPILKIAEDSVPAGRYRLVIVDKGDRHNFHFSGAGVDVGTEVRFEGRKVFKITLTEGVYQAVCDPHSGSMNDQLTVT